MEVLFLNNDGRCRWLDRRVLKNLIPRMLNSARETGGKKMYLIEDWVSNDSGRVGVDVKWLHKLGIPVLKSYKDLPPGDDYAIVNTGYDSIVDEEKQLRACGVEIIDEPCPYIRKIRTIFENADDKYQYVLLCEPNHIIIKNFKTIFPDDMILVQMGNYKEKIIQQESGKPLCLVPYVTFLPRHVKQIKEFIDEHFPGRENAHIKTSCMWIESPTSPIVEINRLDDEKLRGIQTALLISGSGSANKSLYSLMETLESKHLQVVTITSLKQFRQYARGNRNSKVLLVRSPIPNNAEKPIVNYISKGLLYVYGQMAKDYWNRLRGILSFTLLHKIPNIVNSAVAVSALAVIHLVCGLMHLFFQFHLLALDSSYRGFILIENLLVGLLFFFMAYAILFYKTYQRTVCRISGAFWLVFIFSVLLFQPQVTTLSIISDFIPLNEKYVLVTTGVFAFVLSVTNGARQWLRGSVDNSGGEVTHYDVDQA